MFNAIEGVGRPTLLIKGNNVLGNVTVQGMRGMMVVGVNLTEQLYATLLQPLLSQPLDTGSYPPHKLVYLRYTPINGTFLDTNLGDGPDYDAVDAWFEDTRIVDEFNFRYGMVPDSFKDVEGYKQAFVDNK